MDRPRMREVWVFLSFAVALVTGCGERIPRYYLDEGVSWELAESRASSISELHYAYSLEVPPDATAPVKGRLTAEFVWSESTGLPVVFDFVEPDRRVTAVRVNGAPVAARYVADHIVLSASAFERGEVSRVEIDFSAGDGSLNRNPDFLYTLFVPDRAHHALPLFDQPNLKARFTLELGMPEAWIAVANGAEVDQSVDGGRRRISFAETEPIPTYLFAFAVGDFQVETGTRQGRTYRMFHRETDTDKVTRNASDVFDLHRIAVDYLEEYTTIEYPFQKFDFVLIPGFQYGGMEHPGAIFYRAPSILLDEAATQGQLLGRASLIAHETAHMWFGDLVTMNWFDDVWMKEVFANFMAAKVAHPAFPEVDHDLRFVLSHYPAAYGVDRTAGANAIRQPLENLREAGTLYGAIIYQKAPVAMKHLEIALGEDEFRDGLREYLDAHRYGNATWNDLVSVLDRRTPRNIRAWSSIWVEEPGRPTIRTSLIRNEDGGVDSIGFEQVDPSGADRHWPQRLDLIAGSAAGWVEDSIVMDSMPTLTRAWQAAAPPDFVLPNGSGVPYGLFLLDSTSLEYLLGHVNGLGTDLLRGAAWVTLHDNVLEGMVEPERYLGLLLGGVALESNEQILGLLLGFLETTYWRLLDSEARGRWASDVEMGLRLRMNGEEPARLRTSLLRSFTQLAMTRESLGYLEDLWSGDVLVQGVPIGENDRTTMALELAVRGVENWRGILDAEEAAIDNPDRLARFRFVRRSVDQDPEARAAFFDVLRSAEGREHEPWVLTGLGYLHHPVRSESAVRFIRPALDLMEEVQRTGDIFFPTGWVSASLGGHNSAAALAEVERYLDETPMLPERIRAKVLQAADGLERSQRIVTEAARAASDGRRPVA